MRILGSRARIVSGGIRLQSGADGEESVDIVSLDQDSRELKDIRGRRISMIFQEPMTSLCPVYTVGNQLSEAICLHQGIDKQEARRLAVEMIGKVGISKPEQRVNEYPHQLSGGMRQRIMIAIALSCRPQVLIADEPTTALDVTVQAQILDLMRQLQQDFGMGIMLITHNLGIVAEMAETVSVMYLGRIVEEAPVDDIFHDPLHPYTQGLLKSIPRLRDETRSELESIKGSVPGPHDIPYGCAFHTRCLHAEEGLCDVATPGLSDVRTGHRVRCFLYGRDNRE
jgi:peptide/nickel transport system ATP-binding protein